MPLTSLSPAIAVPAPTLFGPSDAALLFAGMFDRAEAEHVGVAYCDRERRLLGVVMSDRGGPAEAWIPGAEIVQGALARRADLLIVGHNHPSGDPTPSRPDIQATRAFAATIAMLDLMLLDHVVVAGSHWRSFRAMGLL